MKSVWLRFHPGAGKLVVSMLVAAGAALGAQPASAAAARGYFKPHGFYNCSLGASTGSVYVDSYQFGPGNRYAVGHRHNNRLAGHIQSGSYALRGNKIVGLSGPLKRHHESLLIQRSELLLMIAGRRTGIGCRRLSPHRIPRRHRTPHLRRIRPSQPATTAANTPARW